VAQVFRITEIAAVLPPYAAAPANMRSKLSFTKLKDVPLIAVSGHSECGGAQTVVAYPRVEDAPNNEIGDIVESIATSGADLPRLVSAFKQACEGSNHLAANLLSRHLTLVSLDNASGYPYVNQRIMENTLDLMPLYHVMKRGTGQVSHMERYDVAHKRWGHIREDFVSNMCARPHNCTQCSTCHDTIAKSLEWVSIETLEKNGKVGQVEVPYHIARLISEDSAVYQPGLHEKKRSEMHTRRSVPIAHIPLAALERC
jgi:carbonic anhydrase